MIFFISVAVCLLTRLYAIPEIVAIAKTEFRYRLNIYGHKEIK